MSNQRYACKCGSIIVWKSSRPASCFFCKAELPTISVGKVHLRKLRSVYQGLPRDVIMAYVGKKLGDGVDRHAYTIDDEWVLKVGNPNANRKEVEVFTNATPEIKEYLCPILDYDDKEYRWLIMPRVHVGRHPTTNEHPQFPHVVRAKIGDLHGENIGWYGDKPIIVDYVGGAAPRFRP